MNRGFATITFRSCAGRPQNTDGIKQNPICRLNGELIIPANERFVLLHTMDSHSANAVSQWLSGINLPESGSLGIAVANDVFPADQKNPLISAGQLYIPWMDVEKNVLLGKPDAGEKMTAEECMYKAGIEGYGQYYPADTDSGFCVRVALARAMYSAPQLIILHDIFSKLNTETAQEILTLIRQLSSGEPFGFIGVTASAGSPEFANGVKHYLAQDEIIRSSEYNSQR